MTHLLFQNFRQWSDDTLQGQLGELFQHFHLFFSWKAAITWLVFNADFTSFVMIKPLIHLCFTLGFILKIFPEQCDDYSCSFSQKKQNFTRARHSLTSAISVFKKSPNTFENTLKKMPENMT
jgi:hypothetical protein